MLFPASKFIFFLIESLLINVNDFSSYNENSFVLFMVTIIIETMNEPVKHAKIVVNLPIIVFE